LVRRHLTNLQIPRRGLTKKLGLPKLNFQVMRRTMATQAQSMGSVKDIQAHLRHAKADTTANEYMQELPESVKKMVGSVYTMLQKGGEVQQVSSDLLPKTTNASDGLAVSRHEETRTPDLYRVKVARCRVSYLWQMAY
jgi:hypothetical protein